MALSETPFVWTTARIKKLEKMRDYFNAGALRVWIVDPKTCTVTIHRADGSETIFRDGDRLEDPDVLPGFGLEVEELFEG